MDDLIPAHPNVTLLQLMVDQNSSQCTETILTDKNLSLADAILHDAFLLSMELMNSTNENSTNENSTKVESNSTLDLPIQTVRNIFIVCYSKCYFPLYHWFVQTTQFMRR